MLMLLADMTPAVISGALCGTTAAPAQHPGSFAASNGSQRLSRRIATAQNWLFCS